MNPKRLSALAAALALALALGACGEDSNDDSGSTGASSTQEQATPTGPAMATVKLSETEFKIDPAQTTVTKTGVVEFSVKNAGSVTHALEVEGNGVEEETDDIAPGDTGTLKVKLGDGDYELYCPIDGHKDKGMQADLTVGVPAKTGGENEEEDQSEGQEGESGGKEKGEDSGATSNSDDDSGGTSSDDSGGGY